MSEKEKKPAKAKFIDPLRGILTSDSDMEQVKYDGTKEKQKQLPDLHDLMSSDDQSSIFHSVHPSAVKETPIEEKKKEVEQAPRKLSNLS